MGKEKDGGSGKLREYISDEERYRLEERIKVTKTMIEEKDIEIRAIETAIAERKAELERLLPVEEIEDIRGKIQRLKSQIAELELRKKELKVEVI